MKHYSITLKEKDNYCQTLYVDAENVCLITADNCTCGPLSSDPQKTKTLYFFLFLDEDSDAVAYVPANDVRYITSENFDVIPKGPVMEV